MSEREYEHALNYLLSLQRFGSKLGLKSIRTVLDKLGNPEKGMKVIHIAGTNGKGSVASMVASILSESGFRTGLYTSPHLIDARERIRINGEKISKKNFVRFFEKVRSKHAKLTYFEFLTTLAFLYFKEKKVDFLVLEVGLGGRLDATNVVESMVSVITNIAKEHTDVLGNTLERIAYEKAGIIKRHSLVITNAKGKAFEVIEEVAKKRHSKLIKVGKIPKKVNSDLEKQTIIYNGKRINLPLLGDFQLENVAIALKIIEVLKASEVKIPMTSIKKGLETVEWPGRLEIFQKNPLFIFDCAHNPAGVKAMKCFIEGLDYERMVLILGISKNKDYKGMLRKLIPLAGKIILTKANNPRAIEPEIMAKEIISNDKNKDFIVIKDVKKAVGHAKSLAREKDLILVTGSIYLVGDVKASLRG
jgi:dihydrofolate synthase/folylpolyglutamate synthase